MDRNEERVGLKEQNEIVIVHMLQMVSRNNGEFRMCHSTALIGRYNITVMSHDVSRVAVLTTHIP